MTRNRCQAVATAASSAFSRSTLVAVAALCVAVAGCGGSDSQPTPTAEARGQALYAATGANCIQCHTSASSLRRDAPDATVLADRIGAAIAGDTGGKRNRYASLTRADLLDLGAY